MNAVRDCPAAKWFPARWQYALPRLIALIRGQFPTRARTDVDHILLALDREQSSVEQFAVGIGILLTVTWYCAELLPRRWMAAAPLLALAIIQIAIATLGFIGSGNRVRRNDAIVFTILTVASAWFASRGSIAACIFLGIVVLNALAAIALLALRGVVRRTEQQCGT